MLFLSPGIDHDLNSALATALAEQAEVLSHPWSRDVQFALDFAQELEPAMVSALMRAAVPVIAPKVSSVVVSAPSPLLPTLRPAELASSTLRASSDREVIDVWLSTKAETDGRTRSNRSHTVRAYAREADRFVLWLDVERGLSLSTAMLEDCLAYRAFLADPAPAERWCGPRGPARGTENWRAFEGPLGHGARRQALVILNNLFVFLQDHGYRLGNPWASVRSPRHAAPRVSASRSLTRAQWAAVETVLCGMGGSHEERQLAWTLRFLCRTGLRLAEVVAADASDFVWMDLDGVGGESGGPPAGGWAITVVGKGMRVREVPVPTHLVEALSELLCLRGGGVPCSSDPRDHIGMPLLVQWQAGKAMVSGASTPTPPCRRLSAQGLYRRLKRLFALVATQQASCGRAQDALAIARASTHWLRHTYGSHAVAAGVPLDVVQQNLGHASLATTTIYVRSAIERRMRESQRLEMGR